MQGIETIKGWRYVVEIPIGVESAVFTSSALYGSQGRAIDAALQAYPADEYPDAKIGTLEDEDVAA